MAPEAPSGDTTVDVGGPGQISKIAVATSAVVQFGVVVAVLVLRLLADGAVGDRLGALPLAAIYGVPAMLAALAFRRRPPLLLAAGIASLVLAIFPFSLHSFVFGPVGLIYLIAYPSWSTPQHGNRAAAVAVIVPLLLLLAFVALIWHDDPTCYSRNASGDVTIDRDPGPITSGSQTIEADSDIVETGCSSDTVVWWEALTSLTLTGGALAAATYLTGPSQRRATASDKP
ncbi:MAG: hypothetical protein GEU78_16885 [Actinobacteria bacterium]|nr:hypothetical protein [Actinomycetota bacterium]